MTVSYEEIYELVMSESTRPPEIFPQRLRAAREIRGLDQGDLAQRTGLHASAISHFETGGRKPSFDNLKRLADALTVTTDYLLGRVSDPVGLAGADRIHRHLRQLKGTDRSFAEDMIKMLAGRAKDRSRLGDEYMVGRSRDLLAATEAERLIKDRSIDTLPVDPTAIAESLGILVQPKASSGGVSGMLIRLGNEFGIGYATHIDSDGFRRFSIAHEIGHYCIPGHINAVLAHGDIHESHAGFVSGDPYEREADMFAAALLMPEALIIREMRTLGDGLQAVQALATRCRTSLPATANRYVQKARVPVAMVMSTGSRIDYCFMSGPLRDFDRLEWPRKDQLLPDGTETDRFNADSDKVKHAQQAEADADLRSWFGGPRSIPGTEEIIGLGGYGKTLTILSSEIFADDEDEEGELEESWQHRFHR